MLQRENRTAIGTEPESNAVHRIMPPNHRRPVSPTRTHILSDPCRLAEYLPGCVARLALWPEVLRAARLQLRELDEVEAASHHAD